MAHPKRTAKALNCKESLSEQKDFIEGEDRKVLQEVLEKEM